MRSPMCTAALRSWRWTSDRPCDECSTAPVDLRKIVIFPSPGLTPSPSSAPIARDEFTLHTRIGQTSYASYTLEDSFELVPGIWIIEIWHGSHKLATQSFKVIKPESECGHDLCTGF